MLELVPRLFVGLLPVVVFLVFLIYLDSYKLVGLKTVLLTMLAGSAVAGASYGVDRWILHASGLELRMLSRYIAPFIEEAFKGAVVLALIRSHRIGFHVDAASLSARLVDDQGHEVDGTSVELGKSEPGDDGAVVVEARIRTRGVEKGSYLLQVRSGALETETPAEVE